MGNSYSKRVKTRKPQAAEPKWENPEAPNAPFHPVAKLSVLKVVPKNISQKSYLSAIEEHDLVFGIGPAGTGKCLAKGTSVLMFNGEIKKVEDIVIGDLLMGADSSPRTVLSLAQGQEDMYKIVPTKGDSYTVNQSHILSLVKTNGKVRLSKRKPTEKIKNLDGVVTNISVKDWLNKSSYFKKEWKGYRVGVNFPSQELPLDPYFLGVWLGDGNSHNAGVTSDDVEIVEAVYTLAAEYGLNGTESERAGTFRINTGIRSSRLNHVLEALRTLGVLNNKHIPLKYKANSRANRLMLLAGIMDSDGSLSGNNGYDYISKDRLLAEDVAYVSRSLGFSAYISPCKKTCTNSKRGRVEGQYFRVYISGDTEEIPIRLSRKKSIIRKQKKNVLRTAIKVEPVGWGDYFGFELDGDGLFLLGDFTVTHNTFLAVAKAVQWLAKKGNRLVLVRPAVEAGEKLGFLPGSMQDKVDPYLRPIYDALYDLMGTELVEAYLDKRIIEVAPLAFMRGRTLNNSFVILDEAQNTTKEQMKMFLTRMGENSKVVVTGVITQIDLPDHRKSGLIHIEKILRDRDIPAIYFQYFDDRDIVRHPLVQEICQAYDDEEE